jgi:hypothetical protein
MMLKSLLLISFLSIFSLQILHADILESLIGSYRNHINITGTIKNNTYYSPDNDFSFILPSLVEPGYRISDTYDSKLQHGYITFLDDIGQLYRIDFFDNQLNKSQEEILAELDTEILTGFNEFIPNVSIIKKDKISDSLYFVFYDFPNGSSVLLNDKRIDATRGVLFFGNENKIIILSQQFLSTNKNFKDFESAKHSLLNLKEKNFRFTSALSETSNHNDQLKIGYQYLSKQSFTKARYWIQKSAMQNNNIAQWLMGLMLVKGDGVNRDYGSAKSWFEKSSLNGSMNATYDLAAMYNNGEGGKRDISKAKELFLKLAQHGHKQSIKELIKIFDQENNSKEAEYWSERLK